MFLYPICLTASYSLPAYFCRSSSILYCNGAHRGRPAGIPSFTRGAATTRDKVRCGGMNVKTPARRFYNHPLVLSRLKNFVKVPGRTGFCVDTENAAV